MWFELLQQHVAASSRAKVALELKLSRTTVSLVLDGKYPASTDKIAERVMSTYSVVQCPFMDAEISRAVCIQHHTSSAPTSSPRAMKLWRACQGCDHNPAKGGSRE
jgi:hypothetical protein